MSTIETAGASAIERLDDRGSAVRFETQCVVIPDLAHRSRRPRVVTKSYALPLWKRRASSPCPSTSTALPEDASLEENPSHIVLRVPLPTFSLKHHTASRSIDHTPLPPCLVHRAQPSTPSCPRSPSLDRRGRTLRKASPSPSLSHSHIVTVPLRPCCAACQSVTEAALVSGDAWPEHFSRAASRRRSSSLDGSPRTITIAGSAASASYGNLGVSISVDEVDKRRRASDTGPSRYSREPFSDDAKAKEEYNGPLALRRTTACGLSAADARPPPPPNCMTPATPRIPEEEDEDDDESELFPLPSPKRTPSASPSASPAGSLSSLIVAPANQSSTPSSCSGDSTGPPPSRRPFLAPPTCSSSSSLSLPKLSESTTDLGPTEEPPSPNLLNAFPSLSGRVPSRSPSPRISFVPPTPTDPFPSTMDSAPPTVSQSPKPIPTSAPAPIPIPSSPRSSQSSTSPRLSPTQMRFPWRSRRSVSTEVISQSPSTTPSCSPSSSPTLSTSPKTRKSFSISASRHVIADVLRGVGAMGSGGFGPGM